MGTFRRHTKMEVCEHFLDNLRQRPELGLGPAELEGIKLHFKGMPTRYALDVNTATMDVLNHKRLLDCAREDAGAVSFQVRCVNVLLGRNGADSGNYSPVGQAMDVSSEQVRILFQTPPPHTHRRRNARACRYSSPPTRLRPPRYPGLDNVLVLTPPLPPSFSLLTGRRLSRAASQPAQARLRLVAEFAGASRRPHLQCALHLI